MYHLDIPEAVCVITHIKNNTYHLRIAKLESDNSKFQPFKLKSKQS